MKTKHIHQLPDGSWSKEAVKFTDGSHAHPTLNGSTHGQVDSDNSHVHKTEHGQTGEAVYYELTASPVIARFS